MRIEFSAGEEVEMHLNTQLDVAQFAIWWAEL